MSSSSSASPISMGSSSSSIPRIRAPCPDALSWMAAARGRGSSESRIVGTEPPPYRPAVTRELADPAGSDLDGCGVDLPAFAFGNKPGCGFALGTDAGADVAARAGGGLPGADVGVAGRLGAGPG